MHAPLTHCVTPSPTLFPCVQLFTMTVRTNTRSVLYMNAHTCARMENSAAQTADVYALAAYGRRAIADALLSHGYIHRKTVRFNALNLEISESVWLGFYSFVYNIRNIICNTLYLEKYIFFYYMLIFYPPGILHLLRAHPPPPWRGVVA